MKLTVTVNWSKVDWTKLTFEQRMELRRQRRASPEHQARLQAIKSRQRHREIWAAIRESEAREAEDKRLRTSPGSATLKSRPFAAGF